MARLETITGKAISGEWGIDDEFGTGIPVLRTTNFTNDGVINFTNVVTRTITKKDLSEKYLRSGDIIIEKSGGSDKQPVGRVVYYDGKPNKYLFNNFTGVLRVIDSSCWDSKYLFYALYANYLKGGTQKYQNKTTGLHNLKTDQYIKEFEVPEYPIQEQKQISIIFDRICELISLRKQQLAKLDELVRARFVEVFGEPVQNPLGWPIHQLQDYILFLTSGSRGWAQYFTDDGKYFITIKNVKNCRITLDDVQYVTPPDNAEAKRTKVEDGDLLISITADLGRTGVVTKEIADYGAYINQHLTCIRLDKKSLHPLYVAYYMESEAGKLQFQSKNQNGVKAGLNFNAINSLHLMVPPLERQTYFVDFVTQIGRRKLTIQQSLDKLEMLKKSLMQEYFG